MEIYAKYTLLELCDERVTVKKQNYILLDGTEQCLGEAAYTAFPNSTAGRVALAESLPEPCLSAVMAMWGLEPVVTEG